MKEVYDTFRPLSIKPHWLQLGINQLPCLMIMVISILVYTCMDIPMKFLLAWVAAGCSLYLLYQILELMRMEYIITGDQLIFLHGVVLHSTDYMELYRVVDYQQNSTLLQQLMGLKTVVIYSGDRNTPVMRIIGVKKNSDVVAEIRNRVEYNKQAKHIYEITNKI